MIGAAAEWAAFGLFSAIAVLGAVGMTTTMGMFRSGVFLMASFFGVAGLFVLLSADLLAWLTVMMYAGGMLVMILFMVLVSHDPGGEMMTSMMELRGPERLFSLGLERAAGDAGGAGHGGNRASGGNGGSREHGEGGDEGRVSHEHAGHEDMSMFTPAKRRAMIASGGVGALLCGMVALRPAWPEVRALPDPASADRVGELLLSKYMIAFEGAGLLILLGVFGGVLAARPARHRSPRDRDRIEAAADGAPAPIDGDEPGGGTPPDTPGPGGDRAEPIAGEQPPPDGAHP